MKKGVFIALAMVLCVCGVRGQTASIQWFPKGKATTAYDYGIFTALGEKYSYRYITIKERMIQKLDKDFNVVEEKSLVPVYNGSKMSGVGFGMFHPKGLIQTSSYPFLLGAFYNKSNQKFETIAYKINDDLSAADPKVIYSYSYGTGCSSEQRADEFKLSKDASHVCHINSLGEKCTIVVYDDNLKELWRTSYDFPMPELKTIELSNTGKYLLGKNDSGLVVLRETGYRFLAFNLENGKKVLSTNMDVSNMQEAVFAGTYSNGNGKDKVASGIFLSRYDITKDELSSPTYFPFNKETLDKLSLIPAKADSTEYAIAHILLSNEGDINVIVQRGYYETRWDGRNGPIKFSYPVYIGVEIISISINDASQKNFEEIVDNKIGFTMQDNLMDAAFQIDDKSVLIYLSDKLMKDDYNICTISKTGKIASNKLEFDEELNRSIWQFKALGMVNNRIYIQGISAAQYKYGVIKLD